MKSIANLFALGILISIIFFTIFVTISNQQTINTGFVETMAFLGLFLRVILWSFLAATLIGGGTFIVLYVMRKRERRLRQVDGSFALRVYKTRDGAEVLLNPDNLTGIGAAFHPDYGLVELPSIYPDEIHAAVRQAVQRTHHLQATTPGDDAIMSKFGSLFRGGKGGGGIPNDNTGKLLSGTWDRTPTPPKALPAPDPAPAPPVARIDATTALAQSTGSRWILGQADSGDLAVFNPTAHAHAAIVGATGTGKTTSVGFGLALAALRSGWHVTILDPDGGANWQPFSSHAEWHETDRSNFPDQIAAVHHHYERRASLANPRPCLIVIEEYGDLIRQLRTASRSDADAVDAMLDSLLQRGRKRCIHLALIDQYPQHWSPAVVGGTKFRAVFQLGPNQGAKMEEYKAASLPDVGRFLVRGTEYNSWAMDAQLPALLRQLPAPDKPRRIINGRSTIVPQSPPPPSPDRSVSLSAEPSFAPSLSVRQEVDPTPPTPPTPPNAPNERSEETRLAILAYLDAHPKATQADVRRVLHTSNGYTHQVWHEWHKAQSTVQPINQRPTTVPPTVVPDAIHGWREIVEADNPASLEQTEAIRQAIASGNITVG